MHHPPSPAPQVNQALEQQVAALSSYKEQDQERMKTLDELKEKIDAQVGLRLRGQAACARPCSLDAAAHKLPVGAPRQVQHRYLRRRRVCATTSACMCTTLPSTLLQAKVHEGLQAMRQLLEKQGHEQVLLATELEHKQAEVEELRSALSKAKEVRGGRAPVSLWGSGGWPGRRGRVGGWKQGVQCEWLL